MVSGETPLGYSTSLESMSQPSENVNSKIAVLSFGISLATFFNQPHPNSLWLWASHALLFLESKLRLGYTSSKEEEKD